MGSPQTEVIRRQRLLESIVLAVALPGVAGAVNATGFFIVGSYTSHVTGHAARMGDEIAQGNWAPGMRELAMVLAFFVGAAFAAWTAEKAKRLQKARYALALGVEAACLGAFAVLAWRQGLFLRGGPWLTGLMALVSFAMGLQNALVTRISGAVVRTTHVTGVVTDIGIEVVRVWHWFKDSTRHLNLAQRLRLVPLAVRDAEMKRVTLLATIFLSFISGAVVGPITFLAWGAWALALPVAVLVGLALFDAWLGLQWHGEIHLQAGVAASQDLLRSAALRAGGLPDEVNLSRRGAALAPPDEPLPLATFVFHLPAVVQQGTASQELSQLASMGRGGLNLIVDLSNVTQMDLRGASEFDTVLEGLARQGTRLILCGASADVATSLEMQGIIESEGEVEIVESLDDAIERARRPRSAA